jgi:PadR family transcriptional regulator PadR
MRQQREPALTRQTMAVLSAILESKEPIAGTAIASTTSLASGTLYPILIRLEASKWIESDWEPTEGSAPRRRLYKITGLGMRRCSEEARAWKPFVERFA